MAGLFVDAEEEKVAKWQINFDGSGTDLTMHLYKSDTTPADDDVAGDYTEADFTGYSSATLTGASWVVTPNAPTDATYAQQTFTSSADQTAQNIYGFILKRGTALVYAERFTDAPYVIANDGDYIKITPTLYWKKAGE